MTTEDIDLANPKDFTQINIDNLLAMSGELPFGVYIKLSDEKFTLIFRRGDLVDRERFRQYSQKGVKELFIHKTERRDYITATEVLVNKTQHDPQGSTAQRAVEELTEQTMFEIFEDKIFDESSLRRAQTTVQNYINIVKEDPSALSTFINLSREETYPCRHAIATSVFAVLLARAHQNQNEKMLMIIGLGGLLHDLGMSRLPEDLDDVDRRLTTEEWAQVKMHPAYGLEMIKEIKAFPEEVKLVIEQHHEHWDGSGYPRQLHASEIYYPARVVAIADAFSALTTRRGGRSLYKPEDALALLLTEQGKYDPQLIKAFRSLFNISVVKKPA
jgi:HD-GYP domain-containing protein (c-di-GMP phosphodiesterase class II)